MQQHRVEICGIQETRWKHKKERKDEVNSYSEPFGYTLYTVSAWENNANAATGGIGILLGRTAQELLISVERLSDRILKAQFRGNPAMTVIVAYAPTEAAEEEDKVAYYNQLRTAIEGVAPHDFLAVLTDANAQIGPDDALFTYNNKTNENGQRLLELLEDYQMLAANTQLRKRRGKLWTWRSPKRTLHQIDYILVRTKWRRSVTNCEAYSSWGSLDSDHRVVTADVSLSLRKSTVDARAKAVKYIWSDLATDESLRARYAVEVKNRFQALTTEDMDGPSYDAFI